VESLIHEDRCKKKVKLVQFNVSPRRSHDTPGLKKVFTYGLMLTASYSAKINQQGIPETKHHW
jgi:hypothetical protein